MNRTFLRKNPKFEALLCQLLLPKRLTLPRIPLQRLFPEMDNIPVVLRRLSRGEWSTPIGGVVQLLKIAVSTKPRKILELGSYEGGTAFLMAHNTSNDCLIVAVDQFDGHGGAYAGSPLAARIERRVGKSSAGLFEQDANESYDLIYIDADHTYAGVKKDTELRLRLVRPDGFILWHDYANWGRLSGSNGVVEYLNQLSATLPLCVIQNSAVALPCPAWKDTRRDEYETLSNVGKT